MAVRHSLQQQPETVATPGTLREAQQNGHCPEWLPRLQVIGAGSHTSHNTREVTGRLPQAEKQPAFLGCMHDEYGMRCKPGPWKHCGSCQHTAGGVLQRGLTSRCHREPCSPQQQPRGSPRILHWRWELVAALAPRPGRQLGCCASYAWVPYRSVHRQAERCAGTTTLEARGATSALPAGTKGPTVRGKSSDNANHYVCKRCSSQSFPSPVGIGSQKLTIVQRPCDCA
jgi:hypothetical protein